MPHQLQATEEDRNAHLEDYLDRVVTPLMDDVPRARRRELRAELSAHLEALIEAHIELGSTPEEAVAAAIRQFGSPRQVGKQWLREWRREQPAGLRSALHTARIGLLCFLPASLFAWCANSAAIAVGSSAVGGLLVLNTLLFPITAGLITGMLSRTRHGFGALLGCSGAALLCAILGALEGIPELVEARHFPFAALAMTQMVFWLPLAAAAGAIGGRLRHGARAALGRWASDLALSLK